MTPEEILTMGKAANDAAILEVLAHRLPAEIMSFGRAGGAAMLGLAAIGSALGTGTAAMAAIGAWKKCFAQDKPAPFLLVAFVGAPLSQTLYGFIAMLIMMEQAKVQAQATLAGNGLAVMGIPWVLVGAGIFGGTAIGYSAWYQGKAAAAACDAFADTGKGFANYLMTLGVIETVAILVMAFSMMVVKFAAV